MSAGRCSSHRKSLLSMLPYSIPDAKCSRFRWVERELTTSGAAGHEPMAPRLMVWHGTATVIANVSPGRTVGHRKSGVRCKVCPRVAQGAIPGEWLVLERSTSSVLLLQNWEGRLSTIKKAQLSNGVLVLR